VESFLLCRFHAKFILRPQIWMIIWRLITSRQDIRREVSMETDNATFKMIQWSPFPKVLPYDHPCVTNTRPVYIDKRDHNIKIGINQYSQKVMIPKDETPKVINPIPQTPVENKDGKIDNSISIQYFPVVSPEDNKTESEDIKTQSKEGRKIRYTGDELLSLDISQFVDVLEDYIPALDISVLAGKGGVGKTGFYLQLCLSIIIGDEEFIGKKIKAKFHSALIIATEDNEYRLKTRIQKQLSKIAPNGKSIEDLIVITSGADLINTIKGELENKSFDLVVIDALGDVFKGDPNSQIDSRKFYADFDNLIREFKTAFLFVAHEGKSPKKDRLSQILGSVAIVDRARSVFILSREIKIGLRTLSIEKSNNISDDKIGKPIYLKFDPETLTFSVVTEPTLIKDKKVFNESAIASGSGSSSKSKPGRKRDPEIWAKVIKLYKEGKKQREIAKEVKKSPAMISRYINKYKECTLYDTSKVGDVD
jgi:hypothetical protein